MKIQSISFPEEDIKFSSVTWQELHELTFIVAKQVIESEVEIDRVVTLAKGGWTMTRALVDFLFIQNVASIGVRFYTGINERLDKPIVYQDLPISIQGEKVLLFDDIADTGASLIFAKEYLESRGVESILTATTLYKPHSQLKPDFYGAETDTWVIFPYDVAEYIQRFANKWQEKGISILEIKKRLESLHFAENQIDFFLK